MITEKHGEGVLLFLRNTTIAGKHAVWLGVSLDKSIEHGGDGTADGIRYFECASGQ